MKNIFKIAIIGNGKLTKSLVKGFTASGMNPLEILVVGRTNSDLSFFESIGISTSRNIIDAKNVPTIILLVTPGGIGYQLDRLKEIDIKQPIRSAQFPYHFYVEQKIISICSGTNIEVFAKKLSVHPASIMKATMNTNVEFGKGVIRLAGIHEGIKGRNGYVLKEAENLFAFLGNVNIVSSFEVTRSIATIGAMNAVDARALELMHLSQSKISIRKWLLRLKSYVGSSIEFDSLPASDHFVCVARYLSNKAKVLETQLGYKNKDAEKLSIETLLSTVEALLKNKRLTKKSFLINIKNVAKKEE